MRRTAVSLAVLALTGAGIAVPLTASADPGEAPVTINYSVDPTTYTATIISVTGGKGGETFTTSVLPLSSGIDPTKPASFVLEAVGNGGEIFDQVFDRFSRVVVCQTSSSCTSTPTVVNV